MRDEMYFCLELSQGEHGMVEEQLKELCGKHDLKLVYYRELKDGHVPMHREAKVRGQIGYVKAYLREHKLDGHIVPNPHRRPKGGE